jgi:hypothetical protein
MTLAGGNQIGGAATPFVEELLEVHRRVLFELSDQVGQSVSQQDESEVRSRGDAKDEHGLITDCR